MNWFLRSCFRFCISSSSGTIISSSSFKLLAFWPDYKNERDMKEPIFFLVDELNNNINFDKINYSSLFKIFIRYIVIIENNLDATQVCIVSNLLLMPRILYTHSKLLSHKYDIKHCCIKLNLFSPSWLSNIQTCMP
jgi:hypothetical protein